MNQPWQRSIPARRHQSLQHCFDHGYFLFKRLYGFGDFLLSGFDVGNKGESRYLDLAYQ